MAATAEFSLTLTEAERTQLLSWLEQTLKSKMIEESHTDARDYRKYVHEQEAMLEKLIEKLRGG